MCRRPIIVRNPILDYDCVKDRAWLEVPCGHCEQCKDRKRNDIYIRLYYEYLHNQRVNKGKTYYLTLTYNNKCIPRLPLSDGSEIYAFSKKHIQNYLKRVRIRCSRELGVKDGIRYFISSENGDKYHRPHYHILFFYPDHRTYLRFKGIARQEWYYGFTKAGKFNNGDVLSVGALKYCGKYVCKSVAITEYYENKAKYAVDLKSFEDALPFNLYSKGLGLYALDVCDPVLLKMGYIKAPKKNGLEIMQLPRYLDIKAHYRPQLNINGNVQYVLTDAGVDAMLKRYNRKKELLYKTCCSLRSSSVDIDLINKYSLEKFQNYDAFVSSFMSLSDNLSQAYLDYMLNYRGFSVNQNLVNYALKNFDGYVPPCDEVYARRLLRVRHSVYSFLDTSILANLVLVSNFRHADALLNSFLLAVNSVDEKSRIQSDKSYSYLRSLYVD
ncbi:MAG: replication initiator protein [Microviridae sp.]|nr:MAG: replication initiator protein [Microviridae sp.]